MVLSVTSPGFTGSGNANTGFVRVTLTPPTERTRSQSEIVKKVNKNLSKFNQVRAVTIEEQTISLNRRGGQPVAFVIQNNDFNKLTKVLPQLLDAAKQSKILMNADVDLKFNRPELSIEVDRLRASQLGVSISDVSQTLQMAYSNRRLGYFMKEGKQYQVMAQMTRDYRNEPGDLRQLFVLAVLVQSASSRSG